MSSALSCGVLDSFRCKNRITNGSLNKGAQKRRRRKYYSSMNADSSFERGTELSLTTTSTVAAPSERKAYDAVLKQAALFNRHLKSSEDLDTALPRNRNHSLLNAAYDRCRQVCAEHSKTYYIG